MANKDDQIIMVAIEGFVGELEPGRDGGRGPEFVAVKGKTKVRASHPAVKRWPQFFIADGTPEGEWPSPGWDHAIKQSEIADRAFREEQARTYPPQPPLEQAAQVIQGFQVDGRSFGAGELVRLDDPVVTKFPDRFQIPARPLVK